MGSDSYKGIERLPRDRVTQTDEREEKKAGFVEKAHADTQTEDVVPEKVIRISAKAKTKKLSISSR